MATAVVLAVIFLLIAGLVHFASLSAAGRRRAGRTGNPLTPQHPPVSIVRPVCGIEPYVETTLGSSFHLSWPDYEVILCVASPADPVLPTLERLIAEHPHVKARILTGDDRISVNPKLNNLVKGWAAATHDWVIMADSNVLMPPDYVERLFAEWDEKTGLVCAPPVGSQPAGFWAELECAFLNTFQARWQLAADAAGLGFAQGKSMLWRRAILDRAGGIAALAREVAEDAAATKIVRAAGLKVRLVPRPFAQPLGRRTVRQVWNRQVRWARLRRASFPAFFLPELVAGGFFPLLALGLLVQAAVVPVGPVAALIALWYGAEALLARSKGWPLSPLSPLAWLLRDALLPVLWIAALLGTEFVWHGNQMSIARRPVMDRGVGALS